MTNSDKNALAYVLQVSLFYLVMAWVIGLWLTLMPGGGGATGKFLRGIPTYLWRQILHWAPRIAGWLGKSVLRLSGLVQSKSPALPPKVKEHHDKGGF